MDRVNRKNIGYVPAIISVVFIPLLFIFLAGRYQDEIPFPRIITIFWADTNNLKEKEMIPLIYDYLSPRRNYVEIKLTGNKQDDQVKLDFSRIRVREIIAAKDSINGVNFIFGDGLEYGTMVKAIDILNGEGAERYIPIDNSIYFLHIPCSQESTVIIIPDRI